MTLFRVHTIGAEAPSKLQRSRSAGDQWWGKLRLHVRRGLLVEHALLFMRCRLDVNVGGAQDPVTQLQNRLEILVHAVADTVELVSMPEPPDSERVRLTEWQMLGAYSTPPPPIATTPTMSASSR